ncbi:hypothetical protein BDN72DRAFT_841846 [Pluteus cervinus]|uniref:Uncharacterized protein n=1 Tax=Pluteus cervinus TaxID=181527 RepID=A0ACD3ASR8_9AGAR|nr:hypothetical protein BDN72DRAFT_841846 [Pluteus cervinus]
MFLDLPTELQIYILSLLPFSCLPTLKLVSHSFQDLIQNAVILEYHQACFQAGMVPNPHCPLPISERLNTLREREDAWSHLSIDFTKMMMVPRAPSGIYDLTGGVYLLGTAERKSLMVLRLPSTQAEANALQWEVLDVGEPFIDIGLAVQEHDLVGVLTKTTPENSTSQVLYLRLIQLSTGRPHPHARHPILSVGKAQNGRAALSMEIVGDNLVLIITYYNPLFSPRDTLYVYDWKRGVLKARTHAPNMSWTGLVPLSADVFLTPNRLTGNLELWEIPPTTQDSYAPASHSSASPSVGVLDEDYRPTTVLQLPRVAHNRRIGHISCRGEPNPVGHSYELPRSSTSTSRSEAPTSSSSAEPTATEGNATTSSPPPTASIPKPTQPYLADSQDSLILFNLRISSVEVMGRSYAFMAHRRRLLQYFKTKKEVEKLAVQVEDERKKVGEEKKKKATKMKVLTRMMLMGELRRSPANPFAFSSQSRMPGALDLEEGEHDEDEANEDEDSNDDDDAVYAPAPQPPLHTSQAFAPSTPSPLGSLFPLRLHSRNPPPNSPVYPTEPHVTSTFTSAHDPTSDRVTPSPMMGPASVLAVANLTGIVSNLISSSSGSATTTTTPTPSTSTSTSTSPSTSTTINPESTIRTPLHTYVVPWSHWGPSNTRWLNADPVPTRWITTTAGQRAIFVKQVTEGNLVWILDFNPFSVCVAEKKIREEAEAEMLAKEDEMALALEREQAKASLDGTGPTTTAMAEAAAAVAAKPRKRRYANIKVTRDSTPLVGAQDSFAEAVTTSLPYVSSNNLIPTHYTGVLLDEERLLGIRTDELESVARIDILHIGKPKPLVTSSSSSSSRGTTTRLGATNGQDTGEDSDNGGGGVAQAPAQGSGGLTKVELDHEGMENGDVDEEEEGDEGDDDDDDMGVEGVDVGGGMHGMESESDDEGEEDDDDEQNELEELVSAALHGVLASVHAAAAGGGGGDGDDDDNVV